MTRPIQARWAKLYAVQRRPAEKNISIDKSIIFFIEYSIVLRN